MGNTTEYYIRHIRTLLRNITEYYGIQQNIYYGWILQNTIQNTTDTTEYTEYYGILQNTLEWNTTEYQYYMQNTMEYYGILQNTTEYYRILRNSYYEILRNTPTSNFLILVNIINYTQLCLLGWSGLLRIKYWILFIAHYHVTVGRNL